MGFFSWKTSDTQEPINNIYSSNPHSVEHGAVYLLHPFRPPLKEDAYEGYGVFDGVDAYAWLARMNLGIDGEDDEIRGAGIDLFFNKKATTKWPLKFSFDPDADYDSLPAAVDDPNQGFFFDEHDIDDVRPYL